MLDPDEFLSDFGVRSVSKYHAQHPFVLELAGQRHEVGYEPGDSTTSIFGGNSNWRGPIWMPINFLLIEAFRKFHHYYGDDFVVECPTGSGTMLTLRQVAHELAHRLARLFLCDEAGHRPVFGSCEFLESDNLLFHEYFHADTGQGLGASHQTGWTALIANHLADR